MRLTRRAALIATTYFTATALALPRPARSSYSVVNVDGSGPPTAVPTTVYETTTRIDRQTVTPSPIAPDTVTIDQSPPTVTVDAAPSTLTVTTSIPTTVPPFPPGPPPQGAPTDLPYPPGPPPHFSAPPPWVEPVPSAAPVPSASPVEQITTSVAPIQPAATSAPPVAAWSSTQTFDDGLWHPSSTRSYDDGMWHSTYVKRASTDAPYPVSTAAYQSSQPYGTGAYYPLMPTGGYNYYGSSSAAPYGTGAYNYPSAVPTAWRRA